ncbi:non-ribosomal peptide synthetase [Pseudoalteromonas tunicata]|uniref:non-ribosomal peptide synthetase n=1 Tax=Pseudoalteromonas tunicata TaxID=314281 RepID=UPI00273D9F9D|nr:amino acid adenylation domain-containing protein [Pseudoalteromonas tunicata]MDP4985825.1 amino acid adenylation domain-containing protein [Pseudoalteromonas tunicata]
MIAQLIQSAADQGVYLYVKENTLHFDLTVAEFPLQLKQQIVDHKAEIIDFLSQFVANLDNKIQPIRGHYPQGCQLSFTQQRFWLLEQMQSGSSQYNMPVALNVVGTLELNLVEKVLTTIISRHQILRTIYLQSDDQVLQLVKDDVEFALGYEDLSRIAKPQREAELSQCLLAEASHSFDLSKDLAIRAKYLQLSESEQDPQRGVLLLTLHHIASDGWSMEVLVNEFVTLYRAYTLNQANPLPELDLQYADFAVWQRKELQGAELEKQKEYWMRTLDAAPILQGLPLQHSRPTIKQTIGASIKGNLNTAISERLSEIAKQFNLSPFMLLHAVLAIVLSRHSNQSDIVIGTPVANRVEAAFNSMIGCFVNTLALRLNTCQATIGDYLAHVRQVHLNAQVNQDIPFEQLIDALNLPRSSAYTPLVQIMLTTNDKFAVQHEQHSLLDLPNLSLTPLEGGHPAVKFDLEIALNITEQGLETSWSYDVALFEQGFVEQLSEHFNNALLALTQIADEQLEAMPLNRLSILGEKLEEYLVNGLNNHSQDYPNHLCIQQIFEQQVLRTPDNIAVKLGKNSLTYKELNERANQLAHFLIREYQITPDTFIGLCVERSLEMVIGTLAILKAGAAYVPLDPAYPRQRLTYMMSNSGVKIILSTHFIIKQLDLTDYSSVCIDGLSYAQTVKTFANYPKYNLGDLVSGLSSNHLAYAIYTSGSTGQPKGVLLEHKGIVNVAFNHRDYLEVDHTSKVLHFASMSFDAGTWEYIMALLNGATLIIADSIERLSPESISQLLYAEAITHVTLPPAFLAMMEYRDDLALKALIVGGEACDQELVNLWARQYRMINAYGPTEISICATWAELKPNSKVTIGKPLKNTSAFILDNSLALLSPGVVGELYISGVGLARGYHQLPRQTAERFVLNPYFIEDKNKCVTQYLYKTGDLVRYLPEGELEYLGRIDEQVKIRGFRIEISEIEGVIVACPEVNAVVVTVISSATGSKHLLAYVQLYDKSADENNTAQAIINIKKQVAAQLPDYMMPSNFVEVDQWPLTSNGKIDKRALPAVDLSGEEEYVAATTDTEHRLVTIWAELLNLPEEKISVKANFFTLGGHSLLVSRLVRAITSDSKINIEHIEMSDIFAAQSLVELAEKIDFMRLKQANRQVVDNICDQNLVEEGEI